MKNIICEIRKYAAILALSVSTVLFLSESLFAQGAVVGYAAGQEWIEIKSQYSYTGFPTDAQLDRLTHLIASDIGCKTADNSDSYIGLWVGKLPNSWEGNISLQQTWNRTARNLWLQSLVSRAHAKGVKVSICVGGGEDKHFRTGTNSANLQSFVNDIVSFVNLHGFDGVDIDWEWPGRYTYDATEWNQCYNLLNELKSSLPGKRISIALAGYPNNSRYNNTTALNQIWNKVDAMYLMTYDEGGWPTHSDFDGAKNLINGWANYGINWGTPKDKLFLACAFYGWHPNVGDTRVPYSTYSGAGFSGNRGDLPADVTAKANHCLNNGYGGVFAWELGYDVAATGTNPPSLLNAIWNTRPSISGPDQVCDPGSIFTLDPAPQGTITWSATGSFTVLGNGSTATVTRVGCCGGDGVLTASVNGTAVATKAITPCLPFIIGPDIVCSTGSTFTLNPVFPEYILTWSVTGPFTISGNGLSVTVTRTGMSPSYGILTVSIYGRTIASKAITPCIPTITGPNTVCYSGSTFTLSDAPAGSMITWSVTGPFTVSGTGATATVTRVGTGTSNGELTARVNGAVVAGKTITACPPPTITGPSTVCYPGSTFTLNNPPPGTITWSATGSFSVSGNGATATVTRVGCCGGDGVLTVKVDGTVVATKAIAACPPFITGPDEVCSSGGTFSIYPVFPEYIITWSVTGPFTISGYGLPITVTPTSYGPGYGTLTLSIYGRTIASKNITSCPSGFYSAVSSYPNPATSILNIEIDALAQSQSSAPAVTSGKQLKVDKTFDIRLYDGQGNLLRNAETKGGKVEFSVANLPDGIYYLHIYDGVNSKPEMRQIVVEH